MSRAPGVAATESVVALRLDRQTTIAGRRLPPTARLEISDAKARWLIDQGAAHTERDDERQLVDPGIECWALRLSGPSIVVDALTELELATLYAHDFAAELRADAKARRYALTAIDHCNAAWRVVSVAEESCRALVGGQRPKMPTDDPTSVLRLRQRGPLIVTRHLRSIRFEIAEAQSAVNATLYEKFRRGRKEGTASPVHQVLMDVLRELPEGEWDIKAVLRALAARAKRPRDEQARLGAIVIQISAHEYMFRLGKRQATHGRKDLANHLVEARKRIREETARLKSSGFS